jgi:hypothetical protein
MRRGGDQFRVPSGVDDLESFSVPGRIASGQAIACRSSLEPYRFVAPVLTRRQVGKLVELRHILQNIKAIYRAAQ